MAKYKISGPNNRKWETEAVKYTLGDGFFHFYNWNNDQVFAINSALVMTIRADDGTEGQGEEAQQ